MAKQITADDVRRAFFELVGEITPWEYSETQDQQKLAFYNEGLRDMASKILYMIEGDEDG